MKCEDCAKDAIVKVENRPRVIDIRPGRGLREVGESDGDSFYFCREHALGEGLADELELMGA